MKKLSSKQMQIINLVNNKSNKKYKTNKKLEYNKI